MRMSFPPYILFSIDAMFALSLNRMIFLSTWIYLCIMWQIWDHEISLNIKYLKRNHFVLFRNAILACSNSKTYSKFFGMNIVEIYEHVFHCSYQTLFNAYHCNSASMSHFGKGKPRVSAVYIKMSWYTNYCYISPVVAIHPMDIKCKHHQCIFYLAQVTFRSS